MVRLPLHSMNGIFYEGKLENNYFGHIFAELLKDRLYAPFLTDKKDLTIIDCGANVGLFSLYVSPYAKQIYALEPALQHFNTLSHMLAFNKITNVKPIQKALYFKKTTLPFYHNENQTMYSLYQTVEDNSSPPEMVETITLSELFEQEKIEHVDLLKLDVEGSEIEILGSDTFREIADKIDVIVMELHSWANRNPNQAREALKNAGFKVKTAPSDANIMVATRL